MAQKTELDRFTKTSDKILIVSQLPDLALSFAERGQVVEQIVFYDEILNLIKESEENYRHITRKTGFFEPGVEAFNRQAEGTLERLKKAGIKTYLQKMELETFLKSAHKFSNLYDLAYFEDFMYRFSQAINVAPYSLKNFSLGLVDSYLETDSKVIFKEKKRVNWKKMEQHLPSNWELDSEEENKEVSHYIFKKFNKGL